MSAFSKSLKQHRSQRKLTQLRLAELLDVNPRVYNRWENGEAAPHFDTVIKIADILDISLDDLAGRWEGKQESNIHNHEIHRLYQKVDQLSDEDQRALLVVMDSLIKRSNVQHVMSQ